MRSISRTIDRLRRFASMVEPQGEPSAHPSTLKPLVDFAPNPGALDAWMHVPADLPSGCPLVVVLHGCTQTAQGYDRGSGWSKLADRHGFAVLFPQQRRANNPNLCFNWFSPADVRRDGGEAESIRQMVNAVVDRLRIDAARVYVTGLSAGGAMASAMLATCPDVFAGGAIIAGLPHGAAGSMVEAFDRMRGHGYDGAKLGDLVRGASDHRGPWPSVSVWHGTADGTVDPVNAAMIVAQWREVHRVGESDTIDRIDGHRHRAWHDAAGRVVIEDLTIDGLGHGTPITTAGNEALGTPGPFMLEAGISSTYRIASAWGIVPQAAPQQVAPRTPEPPPSSHRPGAWSDPTTTINDALRAAGLLKG